MNPVVNLTDRVASLVPSAVPAATAAAADCSTFCAYSSCNDGDFFVSQVHLHCCWTSPNNFDCHVTGCC
jgi:hypothetical protein